MGAKTNTFTQNLQTYSDQAHAETNKLLIACNTVATKNDEYTTKERAHNARCTEIITKCGGDANRFEPMIDSDPKCKQLGTDLATLGAALLNARQTRTSSKTSLRNLLTKLETETTTFSAYITKKESSKNPFKTKKSLPTAKEALKSAKDLITKLKTLDLT